MGTTEKFCLRWNDFENNISGAFKELREDKDFFDVTLACDDDQMQAHKVILSACSPFFRGILRRNKHEHPLLYLKGVKYADLVSVLNFMYHGEVNVAQEELNSFLAVAEDLKVKGLTQNNSEGKKQHDAPTLRPTEPPVPPRVRGGPNDTIHPPKRSRPATASMPQPPPSNYHQEDEDIQEVVPIKMEPATMPQEIQHTQAQAAPPLESYNTAPREQDMANAGVVADPNMEYGGEDYGDYGGYDAGYDGAGLDHSGLGQADQDGNKELDLLIANALTRDPASGEWMCKLCPKTHKNKARISRHAEIHFPGFTQQCPYCEKVLASRNSLRTHVSDAHTKGQQKLSRFLQPFP